MELSIEEIRLLLKKLKGRSREQYSRNPMVFELQKKLENWLRIKVEMKTLYDGDPRTTHEHQKQS